MIPTLASNSTCAVCFLVSFLNLMCLCLCGINTCIESNYNHLQTKFEARKCFTHVCHSVHRVGSLYDVTGSLAAWSHVLSGGLCAGSHVPSGRVSVQEGSVWDLCLGDLYPGGLCLGISVDGASGLGSLSRESLSWVSVEGFPVSILGSLLGGVSVLGLMLLLGVSVWGSLSRGHVQGGCVGLSHRDPPGLRPTCQGG